MPEEIREHLTRDQRPFLHPESLQIRYIPSSLTVLLLFSSLVFYRVQVRGREWAEQKLGFVLSDPFLRFVFGLLYGWKIQTWPIIRFQTASVPYSFFYLLVFDRIHDAMCLNKMSRTSSRNIGPQHQISHFTISLYTCTGIFYPCVHQTHLECLLLKSSFFLVWSDRRSQSHLKFNNADLFSQPLLLIFIKGANISGGHCIAVVFLGHIVMHTQHYPFEVPVVSDNWICWSLFLDELG